jgi:hypothetical protein
MAELEFREAIRDALAEELEHDERVIFFGEDVAAAGGVFATTPELAERFGPERVFDTPISELALAGAAFGSAVCGLRPVIEIMFGDFLPLVMDSLVNQASKYFYISNEQASVPLVVRSAIGAGGRFGAIHSQSPVSWFQGVPGLKLVAPAFPNDAKALLKASIRDENPVLFLEHKRLYSLKEEAIGHRPQATGTAISTAGAGIKASAGLVVPFLIVGSRERWRRSLVAAVLVLAAIAVLGLAVFGTHALDALSFLNSNQARSSRWSFPYKTAQLLGLVLHGGRLDYRTAARVLWGVAFGCAFLWLLWRTWRGEDPVRAAGWATFAILLASAWLVPWYVLWLLPLAALAGDRRLMAAGVALSAWMLVIAVPL